MRTPKLCLHSRGVYYVRFKGKYIYFKKDKATSERMYLDWIRNVWGPAQDRKQAAKTSPKVIEAVEIYLSWVYQNREKKLFMTYRSYLRPLVAMVPELPVTELDTQVCESLKQDMLQAGYKPSTVNHTLKAIRRMLDQVDRLDLAQNLPRLRVTSVPQPRPQARPVDKPYIEQLFQLARPVEIPWLVLNYLTCTRPSEMVRLANGIGEWVEENVFRTKSKVGDTTGYDRFILFSDEALTWVPYLKPQFSTYDSYGKAIRKHGLGGPRQMRTAGASHLRSAGVSYKDIRVILGHTEGGAVVHYVEEDFSTVLPYLSQLSVLPLTPD